MAQDYARVPSGVSCNPAPSAPPANAIDGKALQMRKLEEILERYEVSIADANELTALEGFEIVFICDDSGSMGLSSVPVAERRLGVASPTRWDELKDTVTTVAEVACCFDDDGIDVYFLNRSPVLNCSSCNDPRLIAAFQHRPAGRTPLTTTVQRVISEKRGSEKPVLLLIATDGEPDDGPRAFKAVVFDALRNRNPVCKFQILACTADDDQISWINDLDNESNEVDATDDYHSERAEILATGRLAKFTRGDWVMKALLGPVLKKFDDWDAPVAKALPPPGHVPGHYAAHGPPPHFRAPPAEKKPTRDECCVIV
ncbi:hypothetical protein DIPPA_03491 [Diplonema papillatum]|nr:hypothetical protein DIPPA_03491 [Diplonema papillatum]